MSISQHKHMPEPVRRMEVFTGRPAAKLVACGEDGDHCTKPVDFRKGAERLAALVRETMRTDITCAYWWAGTRSEVNFFKEAVTSGMLPITRKVR